ncbi:hypothetical protein ACFOY2_04920 [Nonomuraea purpurea]|uniref:YbjN domain-containing protein n=1 Tax=Nonomuraea purpurea TaxID=1849276 RepID=A0ABV8G1V6_9ACTN
MSTETPETPVAATPPTVELVADLLTEADNDYHDGYYWKLHMSSVGNVVSIGIEAFADDGGDGDFDEATLLPEVPFRAVVVGGDETPLVLKWPAELGLSWDDGGKLLTFDNGIIRLNPRGVDEWDLSPEEALELAGQLAAMAALAARSDDLEGVAFGGTALPKTGGAE